MYSKLLLIALASLFFQGVFSAAVNSTLPANGTAAPVETNPEVKIEFPPTPTPVANTTASKGTETTPSVTKTTVHTSASTPTATPTTTSTVKPEPTTTTVRTIPTTASTSTTTTTTTTTTPETKTTPNVTTPSPTTETSMKMETSTGGVQPVVTPSRSFDAPNFIGGIILTIGLTAIGFVAYKFYKARKAEGNYRTL